jgi:hypothetical protein
MRSDVAALHPTPPDIRPLAASAAAETPDPVLVALTVLAVNRLAPATLRSATYGKALKVVVSDPEIGAVFRAALDRMGVKRSTDRLIEIVVEGAVQPV